ncbi:MAG: type II toxin-antitoxin system prevent-host-death family antitoxin [Phyllobacterium sp.]|uniref:type II toxin-antitoxin system prevent-host-death family antitoxin n=1 Tax=Phyllobacterium sp. TaxID=1871046 RepID=UPI0030F2C7F8
MLTFSSIELQKQIGDVQRAASRDAVVITSHGKPRNILLSVEEFRRLKEAAGEVVPSDLNTKRAATVRHLPDPLGYDVSDLKAAARRMADDVASGRTRDAVDQE